MASWDRQKRLNAVGRLARFIRACIVCISARGYKEFLVRGKRQPQLFFNRKPRDQYQRGLPLSQGTNNKAVTCKRPKSSQKNEEHCQLHRSAALTCERLRHSNIYLLGESYLAGKCYIR